MNILYELWKNLRYHLEKEGTKVNLDGFEAALIDEDRCKQCEYYPCDVNNNVDFCPLRTITAEDDVKSRFKEYLTNLVPPRPTAEDECLKCKDGKMQYPKDDGYPAYCVNCGHVEDEPITAEDEHCPECGSSCYSEVDGCGNCGYMTEDTYGNWLEGREE